MNQTKLREAERELEKLLEEEEKYWNYRSREIWLKWGDRNTKWFHTRATHRKRINKIQGIFYEGNNWVEEENRIGEIATEYYSKLFQSSLPNQEAIDKTLQGFEAKISHAQSEVLDRPFSREDILKLLLRALILVKLLALMELTQDFFTNIGRRLETV